MNVKYKTKNNNTEGNPVFLAIINQKNINISSIRNLELTETRLCIVWVAGSLFCPLKKMTSTRRASKENTIESTAISVKCKAVLKFDVIRNPAKRIAVSSAAKKRIFFCKGFNREVT